MAVQADDEHAATLIQLSRSRSFRQTALSRNAHDVRDYVSGAAYRACKQWRDRSKTAPPMFARVPTVYMKMGLSGFGFGGQQYDMVILFESADRLKTFIDGGWDGQAAAKAVAGGDTAGVDAGFIDGAIVYTLGEQGLMASADISGTRFWVDENLN